MSLFMTLFIQGLLSAAGGIGVIAVLVYRRRQKININLACRLALYVFYNFWCMCAVRCVLLAGDEPHAYSGATLLITDAAVVCAAAVFYYFTCSDSAAEEGRLDADTIACAVLFGVLAVDFVRLMVQGRNFNAAVYGLLTPWRVLAYGFIGIAAHCAMRALRSGVKGWGLRLYEAAVSVMAAVTLLIFPAFETLMANAEELQFTVGQVLPFMLGVGAMLAAAMLAALFMLPDKKRRVLCRAVWILSICAYLQGMLLNGRLFLMEGKKPEWEASLKTANIIIWCIAIAALSIICRRMKNNAEKIMTGVSLALCLMQIIGCMSLIPSYYGKGISEESLYRDYFSERGFYEVAGDENVIVFVLDTYDVDFLEEVLAQEPDFLEPLQDFIYFPDNVSQFSRTFPSIPYMLTEKMHFYDEPLTDYVEKAFAECPFWESLKESGYSYYIYEEDENIIGSAARDSAGNFVKEGHVIDKNISFAGCAQAMIRIGAYRLFPYAYKEYYSYTAGDINSMVVDRNILDIPMYDGEDAELYQQLRQNGLSIGSDDKAFRFIHTRGAHAPYTMDSEGRRISEGEGSPVGQYMGCLRFVYDYISGLKKLGVYDKATIIITADHGENFVGKELEQETNPILFIKPGLKYARDNAGGISDIGASQNDLLPTLAAVMGLEYDSDWGINLLDTGGQDKKRERCHYYAVVENGLQTKAMVYRITGNSRDFANWEPTGEYREFGKYY